MTEYKTTKEQCQSRIKGVCEGCGGEITPIKTVDNSGDPTYWAGCEHCSCFRGGVDEMYYKIARKQVEAGCDLPYSHIRKPKDDDKEGMSYYLDSQTSGLSCRIRNFHNLIKEYKSEVSE